MLEIRNYINGRWRNSTATEFKDVFDPASGELLARTPLSPATEVDQAAQAAADAFPDWRRTPAVKRVQCLFELKVLLEDHFADLAQLITLENGKTIKEAGGEVRRAIENVEVACGIPTMMQGNISEDPLLQGLDYLPQACSPTLDAADPGLDYSLESPPNGGRANMGHSGGTADATPSLADLNGDAVVDGIDVLRLSVSFGSSTGDPRFDAGLDVNGDGMVDGDDLAYVADEFGDSCG